MRDFDGLSQEPLSLYSYWNPPFSHASEAIYWALRCWLKGFNISLLVPEPSTTRMVSQAFLKALAEVQQTGSITFIPYGKPLNTNLVVVYML